MRKPESICFQIDAKEPIIGSENWRGTMKNGSKWMSFVLLAVTTKTVHLLL